MKPLTIYVCEDEEISLGINRYVLEELLKKINIKAYITYRKNYKEEDEQFLASIELAILDIDLEGSVLNGIQLAKKIRELNPSAVFIFITSHSEFAYDVTQIQLSGFLDKPLNQYDFEDALYRGIMLINGYRMKNFNHNTVTFQNGKLLLKERSIISIEKIPNSHEVEIRMKGKKIQVYDSIKDAEQRLSKHFIKLNGSVLVNLAYIFRMEGTTVVMYGGVRYKISLRNREKVRKVYEDYTSTNFI